ncbi:MAG: FAD-binding oxidoreductase [Gemmatimonadota bacterium]|nr:FAD-binding oxidoreductase [Gemmatimonadota bacterium]
MDRRRFCQTTLAAGMTAALPGFVACDSRGSARIPAISLSGSGIELEGAAVNELAEALAGDLLLADHPDYDVARRIWNGMHDKRPALIARCANATDVSHAVTFARERELLVAVRGGGHSWPGKSVCDGGLMIDLSQMDAVRVDAEARRAHASGGALLAGLDTAALEHGLITTAGVVSHTGVGGFTLGGGFGRLNRKHGLAIDNLVSAEIVTADGEVHRISEEQDPDLFWAIRGGGGNFGVVTEFEYRLHPFEPNVFSGAIIWPIAQAREVLDFYGQWYSGLSDDMYVGPTMATTPDGQGIIVMEVVFAGDPAAGERELAPLRAIGQPMDDGVDLNPYMAMQTKDDVAFGHGVRSYVKSGMVREVTPDLVDAMIGTHRIDPRLGMFTHTAGGAVSRVDELATAFPHRNAETMIIIGGGWADPAQDDEAIAASREWFYELEPYTGGYYDNIDYEGDAASGNYGPAYERLTRIKAAHDPTNLFRLNSNIQPASG